MPTVLQYDAGCRMDPPVSEPKAPRHISAATAAAEPPLEPPGTRAGSQGLRVILNPEFSVDDLNGLIRIPVEPGRGSDFFQLQSDVFLDVDGRREGGAFLIEFSPLPEPDFVGLE